MNFIISMQAEARPLIDKFRLTKRNRPSPFPVFESKLHKVIISGIGRMQAAAATGFLLGEMKNMHGAIINLGISGHGEFPTGTLYLANRVFHPENKTIHYPPPVLNLPIARSALQTCDSPEMKYPQPIGYDMEAHAFCSTAYKGITRELVQVTKVVSDNPKDPLASFHPKIATTLISAQIESIAEIVEQLENLSRELKLEPEVLDLIGQVKSVHHFSVTQSHQLEKLVRHAHTLGFEIAELKSLLASSPNAKSLLSSLDQKLEPLRMLQ